MEESLFWADQHARTTIKKRGEKKSYVCAAGITPSGPKHVGNFREVITTHFVAQALKELGKTVKFIYSWDSYDRFRKVPADVPKDKVKLMESQIGMPDSEVIDPWGCHKSWAEHWISNLEEEIDSVGIKPEYIYQHKEYKACRYAPQIRIALRKRKVIAEILDKYREEPLPTTWYPLFIYCEKCGHDSTIIKSYDEEYSISYACSCGHQDTIDFRKKGIVKLPWRVDWPMRWHYYKVDFEPGGKDHMNAGSSFDTGKQIIKKVYGDFEPYGFMYDFVTGKGMGGKMSASKGDVIMVSDVTSIYSPEITRFLFAGTKPNKEFAISFDEDVLKVYEDFYECERAYFNKQEGLTEKRLAHLKRVYELSMINLPKQLPLQLSFRTAVLLAQSVPDNELIDRVKLMGYAVDSFSAKRLTNLISCARNWLSLHAPDKYKFTLNESPVKVSASLAVVKAVVELADSLRAKEFNEESLNALIFNLGNKAGASEFFKTCYKLLINRSSGPRLASFILTVGPKKASELLLLGVTKS